MLSPLLIAVALVAQSPPAGTADATADQIRALVRELDAPQRAARDDAERRLLELGRAALPHLANLPVGASAEVALRVNRVRATIYREQAASNRAGSRVTLDVKDAALQQVLEDLEKQTGNKLHDFRRQFGQQAGDVRVTLQLDDAPFWQAVDELCAATGLEIYHFAGHDGLALVAATAALPLDAGAKKPVVYAGAFRLEARRLVASRDASGAAPGELQIVWDTAWEPRLKPLFFTVCAARLSAVDDVGMKLAARNPELVVELPPQGKACRVEMSAAYNLPPERKAQKLAELKGEIDVLLPAELHTFRFAELDRGDAREERAGAVSVTLERVRASDGTVAVPVRIKYDNAANALESHRAWFYKNPAYLESADGVRTEPGSIELLRQSQNELTLNLIFAPEGDWRGQTLVYGTPADIVVLPIEFAFRDLPLP
ncbi:MAG: hypothetical protein C0483_08465 [Pirellula sp.]|nr:hypothetical protein [Pirellula sp.]